MAIILISQGFRGVDFLRKPSVYLHFKAFAGPTNYKALRRFHTVDIRVAEAGAGTLA